MRNFYNLSRKFYSERPAPVRSFAGAHHWFASDRALLRKRVVQERHHEVHAPCKNIQE